MMERLVQFVVDVDIPIHDLRIRHIEELRGDFVDTSGGGSRQWLTEGEVVDGV